MILCLSGLLSRIFLTFATELNSLKTVLLLADQLVRGVEQARCDDLESLAYILMYLCSPWSPSLVGAQSCHQEAEIRLHHGEEDNHTH